MSDLGTEVTILEALPKILPGCDADIVRVVGQSFKKRKHRREDRRDGQRPRAQGRRRHHGQLRRRRELDVDVVVVSVGRRRYTDDLGPRRHQVSRSTSAASSTSTTAAAPASPACAPVGDCIATPALAHVGFAEGILVIKDILGEDPVPVDYGNVPWCIYCHPEVAFAGTPSRRPRTPASTSSRPSTAATGNGRAMIIGEHRGHGEDHRREGRRRHGPAASSACTWSAPGSPSSSARATWR